MATLIIGGALRSSGSIISALVRSRDVSIDLVLRCALNLCLDPHIWSARKGCLLPNIGAPERSGSIISALVRPHVVSTIVVLGSHSHDVSTVIHGPHVQGVSPFACDSVISDGSISSLGPLFHNVSISNSGPF